jgi:AcrR family transcriptional regulator
LISSRLILKLCRNYDYKMKKKPITTRKKNADATTEEKIKRAAHIVFTLKGYSGARTRDIADEAGINLALLNYYFRSKEKLFQIVMMETVTQFIAGIKSVLMEKETSLKEKTQIIASNYIDMLTKNPDLPVFMLSEMRAHPDKIGERFGIKGAFGKSVYIKQLKDAAKKNNISPLHYFINTMAMIIFPFIARPMLKGVTGIGDNEYDKMMQERKGLIATWLESMLKAK